MKIPKEILENLNKSGAKECTQCGTYKSLDNYTNSKRHKSGKTNKCNTCLKSKKTKYTGKRETLIADRYR